MLSHNNYITTMVNIQQLMQQAQKMQKQLAENQEKMKNTEFFGEAGGGKIKVFMNGTYEVSKVKIDSSVIDKDDPEMLEDLLVVAFNDCKKKIDETNNGFLGSMAGGANLNSLF